MSDRVHLISPDPRRARVDAHRSGLFSCAQAELREHRLQRRSVARDDSSSCVAGESRAEILTFARFLKRQNLATPAAAREIQPRGHFPANQPIPQSRLDVPRLGDVPPLERLRLETRVRTVYRIEIPLRAGHVIDILA